MIALAMLDGAGRFNVDDLEAHYYRLAGKHFLEVLLTGYRFVVSELSSLDLPSYQELIEAAHDQQVRRAPKPPKQRKVT